MKIRQLLTNDNRTNAWIYYDSWIYDNPYREQLKDKYYRLFLELKKNCDSHTALINFKQFLWDYSLNKKDYYDYIKQVGLDKVDLNKNIDFDTKKQIFIDIRDSDKELFNQFECECNFISFYTYNSSK